MNTKITENIVIHILSAFGIIQSESFRGFPLIDKSFKLGRRLKFDLETGEESKQIWGCQSLIDGNKMTVMFSNISFEKAEMEAVLYVHLENSPMYCLYLLKSEDIESDIYLSSNGKDWGKCTLQLQGSFLSAMEYVRTFIPAWTVCEDYEKEYLNFSSFVRSLEADDEGT